MIHITARIEGERIPRIDLTVTSDSEDFAKYADYKIVSNKGATFKIKNWRVADGFNAFVEKIVSEYVNQKIGG